MMTEQIEMEILKEYEASSVPTAVASLNRKEKRKATKKEKRKQKRKDEAEKERQEEEARLNDPEQQHRIQLEEEREKERLEIEGREFEERERLFLEALAQKKAQEEEEQRRALLEEEHRLSENQVGQDTEADGDEEWEYVEEGPPEIIWQGNEIIVKKNKVRVKKKVADEQTAIEDPDRPTSNPLPPQSEVFADYKNTSMISAQKLLENVAQQTPNFGTEQDKAHCPFHLKTGACRFGSRCSRVHFYPDKSCTLLIKNMYNGPGLAWEQDEGLEYTEEEVECSYEEFYEDVHTEFLKFGEIINFKVCRNGSYHLRGNVYVHYKSLDSAILAYHSVNGRYFAGKQVTCEFVGVTRWKIAICGEYMKSNLKICSRGTACNFIHCFSNPGGEYEWADWDKPPPRSWVRKMAALFGYSDPSAYDRQIEEETPKWHRDSSKGLTTDGERHRYLRSQSKEIEYSKRGSRDRYEEDNARRAKYCRGHKRSDTKRLEVRDDEEHEKETVSRNHQSGKKRSYDSDTDRDGLERDKESDVHRDSTRKNSDRERDTHAHQERRKRSSRRHEVSSGIMDRLEHEKQRSDSTDGGSLSPEYKYRRRTYNSDSPNKWSDGISESHHVQRRKSRRHLNGDSGLSDEYREAQTISGEEYRQKEDILAHSDEEIQMYDSRGHLDEDLDRRGRWEPDKLDSGNEYSEASRSRGGSKSRDRKRKRRSGEMDAVKRNLVRTARGTKKNAEIAGTRGTRRKLSLRDSKEW